jgi:hypothetical protein
MTRDDLLTLARTLTERRRRETLDRLRMGHTGLQSDAVRPAGGGPRLLDIDAGDRRDVVPAELATRSRMAERHTALGAA